MPKSWTRTAEGAKYRVEVEQHGVVDTEYFHTFESLCGQYFNYALCDCRVISLWTFGDELTEQQEDRLARAFAEGSTHWSHFV